MDVAEAKEFPRPAEVACVFEQLCPGQITYLPVFVNGLRFFAIHVKTTIDALDKKASVVKIGTGLPVRIFAFDFEKLYDPLVFSIPEERELIFMTETLAEKLENLKLRGIEIYEASGVPRWHTKWLRRTVKDVKAARLTTT